MKAALMLVATITATAPTWGAWTALGEDDAKAVWSLNVAGPRASGAPAIASFTAQVLDALADMGAIRHAGQHPPAHP